MGVASLSIKFHIHCFLAITELSNHMLAVLYENIACLYQIKNLNV